MLLSYTQITLLHSHLHSMPFWLGSKTVDELVDEKFDLEHTKPVFFGGGGRPKAPGVSRGKKGPTSHCSREYKVTIRLDFKLKETEMRT